MKSREQVLDAIDEAVGSAERYLASGARGKARFEVAIELLRLYRSHIERSWPPTAVWVERTAGLGVFAARQFDTDCEDLRNALFMVDHAVHNAARE